VVSRPQVALVGLGAMGRPMSRNLSAEGFDLAVANRHSAPFEDLVRAGATVAGSPGEAARGREIAITVLPDTPDVESVADDVLSNLAEGGLWLDMSTISPLAARRLEAAARAGGRAFLDAPVSGGVAAATEGTLTIMVGGEQGDFERAAPVLECLGARITHVGDAGAGQIAKAANQILVGGTIALVAEALLLVRSLGVDPEPVRDALLHGFAGSRVLDVHGGRMLARTFDAGFRSELQHKDLSIALDVGRQERLPLPMTAAARELFNVLRAQGGGELDHSALLLTLERMAGREDGA
jgi:2-hydroxy-3-oxopropionate reductase